MRFFERSIDIDAPAHQVWRLWTDVEHWPDWTASMTSIQRLDRGPFGVGSKARVKQPRLRTMVWEVTECDPDTSFVWVTRAPGLRVLASHRITPRDTGVTAVLRLEQTGPLASIVERLLGRLTRSYLDLEAEGLKTSAESGG